MAGTTAGGKKASETNKKRFGADFYREIGRIGGSRGHTGGFASNPELARIAGAKGGRISRRAKQSNEKWGAFQGTQCVAKFTTKKLCENYIFRNDPNMDVKRLED